MGSLEEFVEEHDGAYEDMRIGDRFQGYIFTAFDDAVGDLTRPAQAEPQVAGVHAVFGSHPAQG